LAALSVARACRYKRAMHGALGQVGVAGLVGVRYPRSRKDALGHVESYFLKANDPLSQRAVWLKTTIYAARGVALAEAWAIAFDGEKGHVAVKTSVPFASARFAKDTLDVEVDGVTLRPDATRGALEGGERRIAWDLTLRSDGMPLVHYPRAWMYEARFPASKLVSPYPDLRATGSLVVNGEAWEVDRWPGLLGHNWGPRHAPVYAWGHCNVWEKDEIHSDAPIDDLVLEGVSGRVKVGPVLSPLMTILCMRWRGVRFDLNAPSDWLSSRSEITPRRWTFQGQDRHVRVNGELWAATDDFVGLYYENPGGPPTHCLNSKLARARLEIEVKGRAPFSVRSSAAALEIGTTDPTHGVRMYV
jgi:hypothetical protein